jgi:Spy/CpxP family protein refolding chaperone
MARYTAWILAAAVLSAAAPTWAEPCDSQAPPSYPGRPQDRRPDEHRTPDDKRPPKWWVDTQSRAELGITDQQSAEIEQIFSSSLPRLRAKRQELDQLEATLAQTITDSVADPSVVKRQVDKVEDLRAELNKGRTLMLYRMHRVLTAEQRQKLQAIFQRRERERGGDGRGKR